MEKIFLYKNASGYCFVDYLAPVYAKALRSHIGGNKIEEPLKEVLTAAELEFPYCDGVRRLITELLRCEFNKTEVEYLLDAIYAWREGEETDADEPIDVARPKKRKLQSLGVETEKGAALDAVLFLSTDEGLVLSEKLFALLDAVKELQRIDLALEKDELHNFFNKAGATKEFRNAARFIDEAKERLVSVLKEQTGSEDKAERIVEVLCKIYDVPEVC
jgi:hypothetical protein